MPAHHPKVDAYIAKSQPFAQPILTHIRELFHQAGPGVEETIKWSMPFFMLNGVILGNMAAFKQHCSLGLWGPAMTAALTADGYKSDDGMGSIGRLTRLTDLPPDKKLLGYFRQAVALVADGKRTSSLSHRSKRPAKPAPETPPDLAAALKKNKQAAQVFKDFSPGGKREYVDWIVEAKRTETREKRIIQAVEWIAEGKQRNWKYQNC